jgi:hypothetical protein
MLKNLMNTNQPSESYEDDESRDESLGLSDEDGHPSGQMRDNDVRNAELVIDDHSEDPFAVMRIQTYDDAPMAKGKDEVVIKIEVRYSFSIYINLPLVFASAN